MKGLKKNRTFLLGQNSVDHYAGQLRVSVLQTGDGHFSGILEGFVVFGKRQYLLSNIKWIFFCPTCVNSYPDAPTLIYFSSKDHIWCL